MAARGAPLDRVKGRGGLVGVRFGGPRLAGRHGVGPRPGGSWTPPPSPWSGP